jgi:hypothetical protein
LITRLDSVTKPFSSSKPEYDGKVASLNFVNLTNTKVPSNTFDDLWDWRLNQGDLLGVQKTQKALVAFEKKMMQTTALATQLEKESAKENSEDKKPEEQKEEKDNSKTGSEAEESDLEMKQFNVLSKLADMDPASLQRRAARQPPPKLQIPPSLTSPFELPKIDQKRTKRKNEKHSKNDKTQDNDFDISKDSFSLSDEEPTSPTKKKEWRKKKANSKVVKQTTLQSLKYDEDFQYIGSVKILDEVNHDRPDLGIIGQSATAKVPQNNIRTAKGKRSTIVKKTTVTVDVDPNELKNEADPRLDDKEKPNDEKGKTEEQMKKKKKKKKEKETKGKEIDLTKSYYEQEENIAKYYKEKLKYNYLKIESHFPYDKIPNSAFSSIQDVVPHFSLSKKELSNEQQVIKQSSEKFPFQYNFPALNNAKKIKEKKKKETKVQSKTSETGSLNKSNLRSASAGSTGKSSEEAFSSDSEIDNFEEEYQYSTQNTERGSTKKLERHKFFKTMERFIKYKPFPLEGSRNKSKILKAMVPGLEDEKPESKISNTVEPSSPLKSSKTSKVAKSAGGAELNADEAVIIEQFNRDRTEVDKQYKEFKAQESEHHDFKTLYVCIRANDAEHKMIEKYNWSGNQIFKPYLFTMSQTEKTIDSLNHQKHDIWKKGFSGFIYTARRYAREFINSSFVNMFLMISVFLNTIILAMDGLTPDSWTDMLNYVNLVFTGIFIVELVIKLFGLGFKLYLKDFFNVFDAFVVSISIVELVINSLSGGGSNATSGFRAVRIFRIFRVLRVTRLLRSMKFMKVIIEVLKSTAEQFMYIVLLMFLFVFIFTLLGTQLFGGSFSFNVYPYKPVRYNFDSFSNAFFTAFTVLTVENWNGVLINCLRSDTNSIVGVIYLIAWIFIGNYIFINLFLSILLEGFENSQAMLDFEELENETRELARVHKHLVEKAEEKKLKDETEFKEAYKKVLIITQPEKFTNEEVIKKNQACYLVVRDEEEDGQSLSDECDIKNYLAKGLSTHKSIIDPYVGVTCYKSLYYFKKTHWLRLLCGKIVSHPK